MKIIPAIDLMNGRVVQARRGRRNAYRPINTPLCQNPDPFAVIDTLLSLHPFTTLYIADLDALMGNGDHEPLITRLAQHYRGIAFWVDRGLTDGTDELSGQDNRLTVIGSESLPSNWTPFRRMPNRDWILSLDYLAGTLIGPQWLLQRPLLWPDTVILMNLSRVGASTGPDLPQIERFIRIWPNKRFVAAGGIRGEKDLVQLKTLGASAVLVASALHDGSIGSACLARFNA